MKIGEALVDSGQGTGDGTWWRVFVFSALVLSTVHCALSTSHAAEITASLDRPQVRLNEQAVLSVTVSGSGDLPAPQLPALPNFQVYNAGRAQNFSWINGQASASVTYSFVLTPLKEGRYEIPPIRLESQPGETAAMALEVVKGEAASAPGGAVLEGGHAAARQQGASGIFITGTVDKTTVYVGEPVTYVFRLYNRVPLLSQPRYQPPEMAGFWTEDLPPQRNFTGQMKGVPYNVTEVRTALFPSSPGKSRIGSAALAVRLENVGTDPFSNDFFAQFFGRGEEKVLRTDPVAITVRPLPEGKPEGFKGAVGRYSISAAVDKASLPVGQPLTLTVTVSGQGNIKSLPEVTLPSLANFRNFDATAATNIEKKDYRVQGSKVFKTVLIPTASGDYEIPPIPFSFFDPEERSYKTVRSRPVQIHVAPGPTGNTSVIGSPAPEAVSRGATPGIRRLTEDIRYIKTPATIRSQSRPLYEQGWLRWLLGLLVAGVLGLGLFRLYQRLFLSNTALNRFKTAKEKALATAARAEDAMTRSQTREAASLLADALQGYLADKLSVSSHGLALKETMELLKDQGLHAHDVEKVRNLWETLDLFQFAPTQVRPEELRQARRTLDHVIDEIEKDVLWKN